jgi:acyl-CoA synthetase (AMP-forming)/AMP-acid ligase II
MLPGEILAPHRGARTAIEGEARAWSCEELDDLAHAMADGFVAAGLEPGDRVSLLCANEPALAAAYLGAFRARVVANPINNRLLPEEVAYILEHAQSRVLVASADFVELAQRTLPLLASPPRLLRLEECEQWGRTPGTHPGGPHRGASPGVGAVLL